MMLKLKNSLMGIAFLLIVIPFKVTAINIDFNSNSLLTELEATQGVSVLLDNEIDTGEAAVINSTKWWSDSAYLGNSSSITGAHHTTERLIFNFDYVVQDLSPAESSQLIFDNDFNHQRGWQFGVSSILTKMTASEPTLMTLLGLGLIGLGFSSNRKSQSSLRIKNQA